MSFPIYTNLRYGMEKLTSSTREFDIGFKGVTPDGRVFHYAYASSALLPSWGVLTNMPDTEDATIGAAALVGATSITCDVQGTTVAADAYAGGYAIIWTGATDNITFPYKVKSNTYNTVGLEFTVTLEEPLVVALGADAIVTLFANEYASVMRAGTVVGGTYDGWCGYVGIPAVDVDSGDYCWIQTWGPCTCSCNEFFGGAQDEHMAYFWRDGSITPASCATAQQNKPSLQLAGAILPFNGASGAAGDLTNVLLNLMITP